MSTKKGAPAGNQNARGRHLGHGSVSLSKYSSGRSGSSGFAFGEKQAKNQIVPGMYFEHKGEVYAPRNYKDGVRINKLLGTDFKVTTHVKNTKYANKF